MKTGSPNCLLAHYLYVNGRGETISSSPNIQTGSGTQPSLPTSVNQGSFPGHEVHHSSPSGDKVKNEWSFTSTSPICLHGVQKDNFTSFMSAILKARIKGGQTLHSHSWGDNCILGTLFSLWRPIRFITWTFKSQLKSFKTTFQSTKLLSKKNSIL